MDVWMELLLFFSQKDFAKRRGHAHINRVSIDRLPALPESPNPSHGALKSQLPNWAMRTSAVSWCCHRSTSQKLQEMNMAWWTGIFTGLSSPFLAPPQWYKTPGWSCRIPISSHESVSCVRHQLSLLTTNASNFAWDTLLNEQNIKKKQGGKPPTPTSQTSQFPPVSKTARQTSLLRDQRRCSLPMPLR